MERWEWVAFRVPPDASRGSREIRGAEVDTSLGRAHGTTPIASSKNGPSTDTRGTRPWRRGGEGFSN